MDILFANNVHSTLSSGIGPTETSITLASGTGFPLPTGVEYFYATIQSVDGTVVEIVKCTARSGAVLTVTRAQDGTSGASFVAGDYFGIRLVRQALIDIDYNNVYNVANGIAPLNGDSKVPLANLIYNVANGIAPLNADAKVPIANLIYNVASGVAPLDGSVKVPLANLYYNVASGLCPLDSGGKVPMANLPNEVMSYKGTWNASTNTPTLADGTGNQGEIYRVSVAGTQNLGAGSLSYDIGDYVAHNGTAWEKWDATSSNIVLSVAGKTGTVTLVAADVTDFNAAAVSALAASLATKAPKNIGINLQNTNYVLGAGDDNGLVYSNDASGPYSRTVNTGVFSAGSIVNIENDHSDTDTDTIVQGSGFTLKWGSSTGNRTLAKGGVATLVFKSATEARLTGSGIT